MKMKFLYPPRPRGKMLWTDLNSYEESGEWVAQRKFRGSNAVINISPKKEITLGSRHGKPFANFSLSKDYKEEIIASLNIEPDTEYWLNGELMNKDANAGNQIILYDVLHYKRYLFGNVTQIQRLEILNEICKSPKEYCDSKIALRVSGRIWMAETFYSNFLERFRESEPIQQLEGLVLRRKSGTLNDFGTKEYETTDLIRCRKPFMAEDRTFRSGGYEF